MKRGPQQKGEKSKFGVSRPTKLGRLFSPFETTGIGKDVEKKGGLCSQRHGPEKNLTHTPTVIFGFQRDNRLSSNDKKVQRLGVELRKERVGKAQNRPKKNPTDKKEKAKLIQDRKNLSAKHPTMGRKKCWRPGRGSGKKKLSQGASLPPCQAIQKNE